MYSVKHKIVNKVYKHNYLLSKLQLNQLLEKKTPFMTVFAHNTPQGSNPPEFLQKNEKFFQINLNEFPSMAFQKSNQRVEFIKKLQSYGINGESNVVIVYDKIQHASSLHWKMKLFNIYGAYLLNGGISELENQALQLSIDQSKKGSVYDFTWNAKDWIKHNKDVQMIKYLNSFRATTYQLVDKFDISWVCQNDKFLEEEQILQNLKKNNIFPNHPILMVKNNSEHQLKNPLEVGLFALDYIKAENWLVDETNEDDMERYTQNQLDQSAWKSFYHNVKEDSVHKAAQEVQNKDK